MTGNMQCRSCFVKDFSAKGRHRGWEELECSVKGSANVVQAMPAQVPAPRFASVVFRPP